MAEPATVKTDKDLLALFFHKYISNLYQLPIERIRGNNTTQNNSSNSSNAAGVGVGAGDAPEGAAAAVAADTKKNGRNTNGMNTNGKNTRKNSNAKVNNNTRKFESLVSRYDQYMSIMQYTYDNCNSIETLFEKLYSTTKNYRALVERNKTTGQDFYHVNTHGTTKVSPMLIPANTVLIFLTPINRYGMICNVNENTKIKETFKSQSNRLFIQNNLPCIDKFDKLPNNNRRTQNASNHNKRRTLNTRDYEYHKMFKNATVLYPGQYYYDLDLSFTQTDSTLGISYFSGDNSHELINKQYDEDGNLLEYEDTLSNLIEGINSGNLPPEKYDSPVLVNPNKTKTKYFIISCCRNFDISGGWISYTARRNYIYENFMFYYNLIMANCNSTSIAKPASYDLPDKMFASAFMYVEKRKIFDPSIIRVLSKKYVIAKQKEIIANLISFFGVEHEKFFKERINDAEINDGEIYYSSDAEKYIFDISYPELFRSSKIEKGSFIELILINTILQKHYRKIVNVQLPMIRNIPILYATLNGFINDVKLDFIDFITNNDIKAELKQYFTELNELLQECINLKTDASDSVNVKTNCPKLYKILLLMYPQKFDSYYDGAIVQKKDDFYNYLESLVTDFLVFLANITPEQYFDKELSNAKKRGNTSLGNEGRGYLIKTYNTMNTSLPAPVKKFIAEESTRVITHLGLDAV